MDTHTKGFNNKKLNLDVNSIKNIIRDNKQLHELKDKLKDSTANDADLYKVLKDVEEYFRGSEFPSLKMYSGIYSGEILDLCFEHYPEIFNKDRYRQLELKSFRRMLSNSYSAVTASMAEGGAKPNQLVDFLKYIERFNLVEEKEEINESKDISKIEFIINRN